MLEKSFGVVATTRKTYHGGSTERIVFTRVCNYAQYNVTLLGARRRRTELPLFYRSFNFISRLHSSSSLGARDSSPKYALRQ